MLELDQLPGASRPLSATFRRSVKGGRELLCSDRPALRHFSLFPFFPSGFPTVVQALIDGPPVYNIDEETRSD